MRLTTNSTVTLKLDKCVADLFKNSFIEELLKLLVTIVNAELFKTIHLEILYNIENMLKIKRANARFRVLHKILQLSLIS